MESTIFSIDPMGTGLLFAFYIGVSLFLAVLVYLILTKPSVIRSEFRCLFEPVRKRNAMICAVVTMLPLSLYGYWDCWKYYYALAIRDNKLIVKYLFPTREHEIADLRSMTVTIVPEPRKGIVYRIKLITKENTFTSQQMTRAEFEINNKALTQEIQKTTGLSRPVER